RFEELPAANHERTLQPPVALFPGSFRCPPMKGDPAMKRLVLPLLVLLWAIAGPALADGPEVVNYQGVLRNAGGTPLTGTYDMTFRFFDDPNQGDEILIDRHLAANGLGVSVSGGLFNVLLGDGVIADGGGPGVYASLLPVFSDYETVWLEMTVGTETL